MPFHRDDAGTFWTSETIRSPSTFAYTYPELVGLNGNDTSALVSRVNALYGPNATPQKRNVDGEPIERSALTRRDIAGAPNFSDERQYIANIKVHKFGLDGSFNVYVFLGDKPGLDSRQWTSEGSFIGVNGILAQSGVTDATKVKQEANGAVPLTAALEAKVRNGQLEGMKEDAVGTYLRYNLRWRISKVRASFATLLTFSISSRLIIGRLTAKKSLWTMHRAFRSRYFGLKSNPRSLRLSFQRWWESIRY